MKPVREDEIKFEPEDHKYTVRGEPWVSVTTAIERVFPSKFFCSDETLKRAREFGNAVHAMLDLWAKNRLNEETLDPVLTEVLTQARAAFIEQNWDLDKGSGEQRVAHSLLQYAGTLDRKQQSRIGKWGIIDFKTGSRSWKVGMQTVAYREALNDMEGNKKIEWRAVLYLGPDFHRVEYLSQPADMNNFLSVLNVYNLMETHHV